MLLAIGNMKVGEDTLTLNMGAATDCPSDARGLCRVMNRFKKSRACFSKAAEGYCQGVLPRHRSQEVYWRNTPATTMIEDIEAIYSRLNGRAARIKYFRFNEAGDFWSQACVDKANDLSEHLKSRGLIVYCNTARSDLDVSHANFLVRGSGWPGPNGETRVLVRGSRVPDGFRVCPADCRKCSMCKIPFSNIVYWYHIGGASATR